ncbi:MAG: nitroreductase family protein [Planctomycetota bacterium]
MNRSWFRKSHKCTRPIRQCSRPRHSSPASSAAVENMLLGITALGYASVWIDGWLRVDGHNKTIGKLLGVPETKIVRILLPIGVPAKEVRGPEKMSFNERAFFNKYGQ